MEIFNNKLMGEGYKATKDKFKVLYEIRKDSTKRRKNCYLYINDVLIMKNQDESTICNYLRVTYNVTII